jgi:hypothetical protein
MFGLKKTVDGGGSFTRPAMRQTFVMTSQIAEADGIRGGRGPRPLHFREPSGVLVEIVTVIPDSPPTTSWSPR